MRIIILLLMICISVGGISQKKFPGKKRKIKLPKPVKTKHSAAKGTLFAYWGYNRTAYSKSNITFVGPGYSFKMKGARAHDNQSPFSFENYFSPANLSVPQFNARIGYNFKNHWAVSLGYDHLKYIFADKNNVLLSGNVTPGIDNVTGFSGVYNQAPIITNRNTFHYENSNGLNYIRLEFSRIDQLFSLGVNKWFALSTSAGAGTGVILSISDFDFAGKKDSVITSLSGVGISTHAGLRFEFFKHFFIQPNVSAGFMYQSRARTRREDIGAYATHHFGYLEANLTFGCLFYIKPVNGCDKCPQW